MHGLIVHFIVELQSTFLAIPTVLAILTSLGISSPIWIQRGFLRLLEMQQEEGSTSTLLLLDRIGRGFTAVIARLTAQKLITVLIVALSHGLITRSFHFGYAREWSYT